MNFLAELQRLRESVPHPAILTTRSVNSEYCPYSPDNKNCYLIIGRGACEDCYYGYWIGHSFDCCDNLCIYQCTLCYECVDCEHCFNCDYCQDCKDCWDCEYCYDCVNCKNCFGCVGLRYAENCIFNEKFSKETYKARVKELKKNPSKFLARFQEFQYKIPRLYMHQLHNTNCIGDYLYDSKNSYCCFDCFDLEDCRYMFNAYHHKDSQDCAFTGLTHCELCYEVMSGVSDYNCNFCNVCWDSQNLEYCEYVFNSHDCFGCVSRNHASYEILNKKYEKDEYFEEVAKIKDKMRQQGIYGRHLEPVYPEFLAILQ